MLTILAGLDWVKPSGTEVPEFDQGPTSQTTEAKTYGRKNTGDGGRRSGDVRAFGAEAAVRPKQTRRKTEKGPSSSRSWAVKSVPH